MEEALILGQVQLPLMRSVAASIVFNQPRCKVIGFGGFRGSQSASIETQGAFINRLGTQRKSERWTCDTLSLKSRIFARLIRKVKLFVTLAENPFFDISNLRQFCERKKLSSWVLQDNLNLLEYIIRRYPSTWYCLYCGLVYSEILLPDRIGTAPEILGDYPGGIFSWAYEPDDIFRSKAEHIHSYLYTTPVACLPAGINANVSGGFELAPIKNDQKRCNHCLRCGNCPLLFDRCLCWNDPTVNDAPVPDVRLWYH